MKKTTSIWIVVTAFIMGVSIPMLGMDASTSVFHIESGESWLLVPYQDFVDLIYTIGMVLAVLVGIIFLLGKVEDRKRKRWHTKLELFVILYVLGIVLFGNLPIVSIGALCISVFLLILAAIDAFANGKTDIENIESMPRTEENIQIMNQGYQIYYDAEHAKMTFNVQALQHLLSEDLYSIYLSQLNDLIKNQQKNILTGFEIKQMELLNRMDQGNFEMITMFLKVSCSDYIVDRNSKVIKGDRGRKQIKTYQLTFERSKVKNQCLNCGNIVNLYTLECPVCHSRSANLNFKMRLLGVKLIRTEWE